MNLATFTIIGMSWCVLRVSELLVFPCRFIASLNFKDQIKARLKSEEKYLDDSSEFFQSYTFLCLEKRNLSYAG